MDGKNCKSQKLYEPLENGACLRRQARRRPDKIWVTRQVSPARKFVFIPPPSHKNPSHIVASGREPRIGEDWAVYDPDGGISILGVGGFPPQTPPSAHAEKQENIMKEMINFMS